MKRVGGDNVSSFNSKLNLISSCLQFNLSKLKYNSDWLILVILLLKMKCVRHL